MRNEGDIGLVLSGGGAKGAFQAGVWKAMHQLDLTERVRVISGTSVGALNAAAFASIRDPETICRFWRKHVEEVATPNLRSLENATDSFRKAAENVLAGKAFPFHGLLDRTVLAQLVRGLLPSHWPEDAPEVIATSLECRGGLMEEMSSSSYRKRRFRIGAEPDPERRLSMLLASAAIPWGFDPVEIDGKRFVDGGWDENGGENIPVTPIWKDRPDLKTLVVVRCNSKEVEPEPLSIHSSSDLTIVEVRPSVTLPGILDNIASLLPDTSRLSPIPILGTLAGKLDDLTRKLRIWSGTFAFTSECAKRFIRQGYFDGLSALRPLRLTEKLNW